MSAAVALAALLALASGCNMVGYAGYALAGGDKKTRVAADYRGLEQKRVAVIVAADEAVFFEYPAAPLVVNRAVSRRLATSIPGIRIVDPEQVHRFQLDNPYWATLDYGQLLKRFDVDRLVYIDLIDYTTHEPGNAYVWKGVISANIGVAEADAANPADLVYATTVEAEYPRDSPAGAVNADDRSIQAGMLAAFGDQVANLFRDHVVYTKQRQPHF